MVYQLQLAGFVCLLASFMCWVEKGIIYTIIKVKNV